MYELDTIDLCCGGGLLSAGLQMAGLKIKMGVDINQTFLNSYQENFPDAIVWETNILDIKNIPRCRLVVGGPPCQDLSLANRTPDHDNGMILVNKFIQLVKASKAEFWIMEEVPPTFDYIKDRVPKAVILECSKFGARNLRPRLFAGRFPTPVSAHSPCKTPAPTVMASDTITSIQVMRGLQGIPSWMVFHGTDAQVRTQIGNGVPIEAGEALGKGIIWHLQGRTLTKHESWHRIGAAYYRRIGGNRSYLSRLEWRYCYDCEDYIKVTEPKIDNGTPRSWSLGIPESIADGIPRSAKEGIPKSPGHGTPSKTGHGIPCPEDQGTPPPAGLGIPPPGKVGIPRPGYRGIPNVGNNGIPSSRTHGIPPYDIS